MAIKRDPSNLDASRRRLIQGAAALPVIGASGMAFGQPTASVNTTKLAITDTEVTVGQLHSSTGTMAISETGSIQAEQLAIDEIKRAHGASTRLVLVARQRNEPDGVEKRGDVVVGCRHGRRWRWRCRRRRGRRQQLLQHDLRTRAHQSPRCEVALRVE
jgi:hypothetical protein